MGVNIMGVPYDILIKQEAEDEMLKEADGYCDTSTKEIVINDFKNDKRVTYKSVEYLHKQTLRHEIIHAFLHESGLWVNSLGITAWAMNEEMVDWIAKQFPKILKAFNECGAL